MANLFANCLSKSPVAYISDDQYQTCISKVVSEGKNAARNTIASTTFGVLASVTMENQAITTFALPASIGSVIESATNAVTDRLYTLVEKNFVELFNKDLPLQEYSETPAYKSAAAVMKLILPVLITSYACDLSTIDTAVKGFVIPKLVAPLAEIIYAKVQAELAKDETTSEPAAIVEPAFEENPVDVVILPSQE